MILLDAIEMHKYYLNIEDPFIPRYLDVGMQTTKAQAEKILIQLQAIYNIPDLKTEDVRMGEFIQELMEEVSG